MCKLRRQRLTQKLSRCHQELVLCGHPGCGIGLADAMCGVVVRGRVRLLATALGTAVAGTTHRVAAGTTAADTGAENKRASNPGQVLFVIAIFE